MLRLPFTTDQFLDVFRAYNAAVWPAQWVLYVLGVTAVVLAARRARWSGRAASGILAVLWLWMGAVYHLGFFRAINPAAAAFGVAFIAQAAAFAWLGVWNDRIAFRVSADVAGIAGWSLALYALVVYPLLGRLLGHRYPAAPTFGLPCPTTILTLALLVWASSRLPRALLVVPVAWAIVATSAAAQLGMTEDFGLPIAGGIAVLVLWQKHRHAGEPHAGSRPAPVA